MMCLDCQARYFGTANVVIDSHSAGLSLVLFAKEGGTVLERLVHKSESGIYAELPFLLGMKYFPMDPSAGPRSYRDIILFADGI